MKQKNLWILLLLGAAAVLARGPEIHILRLPDESQAGLALPTGAMPRNGFPLVVWMHGGLGANDPAKGVKAARSLADLANKGRFALVCPSGWMASPWWSGEAEVRLLEAIKQAGRMPGVDGRRLVFAGVSDGGTGALWLSARLRPRLGKKLKSVAVWSCDPAVVARFGLHWNASDLSGLAVRWTQGSHDQLYPIEGVENRWRESTRAGIKLTSHRAQGAGHDLADHQADLQQLGEWVRKTAK